MKEQGTEGNYIQQLIEILERSKDKMIRHQNKMKGELAVEERNWQQKKYHCRTNKYIKVIRGNIHKPKTKLMMWKTVFKKLTKCRGEGQVDESK